MATACTFDKTNNDELHGDDIRLFKGKLFELAKAAEKNDTTEMRLILTKDTTLVKLTEDVYGQTLLHWTVGNGLTEPTKMLLEFGANPNQHDTYDGETPLMIASGYGPNYDTTSNILVMLLESGGDPNSIEDTPRREGNRTRNTPLIIAAGCCLTKTKLLVEAGANVNFKNEFGESALESALLGGKDAVKITKYLLIEKTAEIPDYFTITQDGNKITILDYLRDWTFDLNSIDYQLKMEIVDYLKIRGLNYWDSPIPKRYFEKYPKDYLERY